MGRSIMVDTPDHNVVVRPGDTKDIPGAIEHEIAVYVEQKPGTDLFKKTYLLVEMECIKRVNPFRIFL